MAETSIRADLRHSASIAARSRHSADAIAAAVNYYIRGQDLKFSFDVTHLNGAPTTSEDGTFRAGDDGYLFRFQFQWLF